ncbi:retrovirus-related pol polyprotein from transposon TNT 1-94 [Tanacetum coccineum]
MLVLVTLRNLLANGFQILPLFLFLGTVRFGNDHVAAILGYGDLQWGNILIARVYYVEGLGHNLFSVGQFCDSDLEVAFRRNTCFVKNLDGVDLLKGSRTTNLYIINLYEMASTSPICLIARVTSTKSWQKQTASHPPKPVPNSTQILHLLHMDLCGPMRVTSINGKRYVLVIVDDYSRYTWVHFLRSKDEALEEIKTFLKKITVLLQALVIIKAFSDGFEQRSSQNPSFKHDFRQSSGLDLTYAPSTITSQKLIKRDLDLLFQAMYDDYLGGQPSAATRTTPAAQAPQVLQTPTASTTTVVSVPTPTNSSLQAAASPNTLQDVDNHNNMSNYKIIKHQSNLKLFLTMFQMLCSMIMLLTRNQLRTDGDMCIYALTVSTMEPKNIKEAMTDPSWIESMQEELLQFKRLDVWVLVPPPDNVKPLTLKWLFKNKSDE